MQAIGASRKRLLGRHRHLGQHRHHDRRLLELQSLWREYSVREFEVDNRVIYVETWYLHDNLRPRCDPSRTVRLDHMDHLWLDDIRRAWHEYLQAAHVLHLDTPGRIRGTQARLDYIAVSANIEPSLVETWVSPDIDLTLHRCDHDCVCAQTFNLSLFKLIADLAINA